MSGTWGNKIQFTIFGESHGTAIGGVISGLPPGLEIDFPLIDSQLKRRNHRADYSTARSEPDKYEVLSGVFEGKATGAPLAFMIRNQDTKSRHYDELKNKMRPGHSDYPAHVKFGGFNDYRGGGSFSGRLTAATVFAGAIARQVLALKGIRVFSHILSIGDVKGSSMLNQEITEDMINELGEKLFAVLSPQLEEQMLEEVRKYKKQANSIGGVVECFVDGLPAGIGDPAFGSVESRISSLIFSIPAVKGIEFGKGFEITEMSGYDANDSYYYEDGRVKTRTNNNGGVLGGISTGMPLCFRVAVKPTASVSIEQDTIDVSNRENTKLKVEGRHDACIVPRAVSVIESAAALAVLDLL